ncbi:hypothetical protein FisN_27Lh110 [Fistulifera solaris]|uniref:BZIP domain-containing protein n=1 Tax=Fistulifera solaris TaxID=1519565 RepID=A0A1Z5KAW1_FISSO|nr:hypothetical protein FisN_27Lh110 [Fistulifera solaris]|eukprot:GAX23336.1 hypothetical protein FisN_27Lh110 [Fistulifera solaris]
MSYPATNEDYLKALEEAYRQGAAAAAQMALQEQQSINNNRGASCPDFSGQPVALNGNQHAALLPFSVPDPLVHHDVASQPQQQQQAEFIMPPPPPPSSMLQHDIVPAFPAQHRSFSMPDMSVYASQKQEDIKRHKRLARNRASARIRRLRKKHLVDAYESEVKSLGSTLQRLKEHEWGNGDDHPNLLQLLSMERGQDDVEASQRQEVVASILSQQLQVVQQLQELMQEQYALYEVATSDTIDFEELASILELTPSQRNQIRDQATGWMQEWQALQTVEASLIRMQENEWLSKNGVSEMAEELYALFNKNQLTKFLIWTDINRDAIDLVNIVNTKSNMSIEHDGPVFQFGVENICDDGFHQSELNF